MKFKIEKQQDPDQLENEITAMKREMEKKQKELDAKRIAEQKAIKAAEAIQAKQYNTIPMGTTPELQPQMPPAPQPIQSVCSFTRKWKILSILSIIFGILGTIALGVMIVALASAPAA